MTENTELKVSQQETKEMEQNDNALTFSAAGTLVGTGVMFVDATIKASTNAIPSLPNAGVMYVAALTAIFAGAMTLSYISRQYTLCRIRDALAAKEAVPVVQTQAEEVPVTA
jgi:hypothetical protein